MAAMTSVTKDTVTAAVTHPGVLLLDRFSRLALPISRREDRFFDPGRFVDRFIVPVIR